VQAALAGASDDRGGEVVFAVGFGGQYRMEEITMMYWGNGMALRRRLTRRVETRRLRGR
jgi:hypothetical protein